MVGPQDLSGDYCSRAQLCLELVTTLWATPVNTTPANLGRYRDNTNSGDEEHGEN